MITTGFAPYEFSEAIVNSKLVLALKKAGHEVDVISRESQQVYATGWSDLWSPLKKSTYFIPIKKVPGYRRFGEILYALFSFRYPISGIRWGYKVYKLALKMNEEKQYNILLTRMPSEISHLIGKKLAHKLKIPWIANWNDPTDNIRPLVKDKNWFKSLIINLLVKDVFNKATINSYPSKELWEHFNSNIIQKDNESIEIIPHIGIELTSGLNSEEGINQEFSLCHAGSIWPNINTDIFLQALAKLKNIDNSNIKFHVFGFMNQNFIKQIQSYELEDIVQIHGAIGYEKMLSEFQKHDVLVLLEAQYKKGILLLSKLSDYVSVKKPVLCISPNIGVIPDYVNHYGGGLVVDNKDAQSVYEGLKFMREAWKDQWQDRDRWSSDGLWKHFCPERIAAKYLQLFDRISSNK